MKIVLVAFSASCLTLTDGYKVKLHIWPASSTVFTANVVSHVIYVEDGRLQITLALQSEFRQTLFLLVTYASLEIVIV